MSRALVKTTLAALLILSVAACGSAEKFRYKMTVEVETPEGLKSGSAVREIRHYTPPKIPMLGESRPRWALTGEAVAVDITPSKRLYAILPGADGEADFGDRSRYFMFNELRPGDRAGPIELWPDPPLTTQPKIDEPTPMLVTFRDENDPKSIERVVPGQLAAVFGPGMKLRRITIRKTRESITSGISRRLKWLDSFETSQRKLSGSDGLVVSSNALAENLDARSFAAGR